MKKILVLLFCAFCYIPIIAQPVCDSVSIESVLYDPFYDSVILVNAYNHSTTFISYPRFTLMTTGATIAEERLNKFGMMEESFHALDVRTGMPSQNSFRGFLFLEGADSVSCAFERDISLCPDTCQMIYPGIGYFGATIITGTLNWTIERNNTQVVASGQLALEPGKPSDLDSVCLTPGSYTFKIAGSLTPGEHPYFSIQTREASYFHTPYDSSGFAMPFNFFKRCSDPTGILIKQPYSDAGFKVYAAAQDLHIVAQAEQGDYNVHVYTIDGRAVYNRSLNSGHSIINLSHVPAGVYMVRVFNSAGFTQKKVVIGAY